MAERREVRWSAGPNEREDCRLPSARDVKAASEAARIAAIVHETANTPTLAMAADIVQGARSTAGSVELTNPSQAPAPGRPSPYTQRVINRLQADWRLRPAIAGRDSISVRAGPDRLLVFQESEFQTLRTFLTFQAGILLAFVLCRRDVRYAA
jgi:hypothetical protein